MLTSITLTQIYYFLQVMELGNVSRAAENLSITQSTLSKSIQAMEENLNIQLFIRNKKRLLPTEAADYLYTIWKGLVESLEVSIDNCRWISHTPGQRLRIGTLDSHRPESYLIDYVDQFCARYPNCAVSIESLPPNILYKKLNAKELDLIFTVKYDAESESHCPFPRKLIEICPLEACMKPTNILAKKDAITIPDLALCQLIVISASHVPSYNRMIQNLCAVHDIHPTIQYSTTSANSQIFNLRDSQDIFICDRFHRDYNAEKLIFKQIIGTESGVAMVWRPNEDNKSVLDFVSMFES